MSDKHTVKVTDTDVFDDAATDSIYIQFNGQEFQLTSTVADDFVKQFFEAQEVRETEGWGKAYLENTKYG